MAWAFVRKTTFASASFSASPLTFAITAPVSGNGLILVLATMDTVLVTGAWAITSISDNGSPGSTWTRAVTQPDTTHGASLEIWYAANVTGSPTSINAVVSGTGTNENRSASVLEYSGLALSPLDKVAGTVNGSGTSAVTGTTGTTTVDQDLAIATFSDSNQSHVITSPVGWTERFNDSPSPTDLTVDEKTVSIGTQSATFTMPGGAFGPGAIATFKPFVAAEDLGVQQRGPGFRKKLRKGTRRFNPIQPFTGPIVQNIQVSLTGALGFFGDLPIARAGWFTQWKPRVWPSAQRRPEWWREDGALISAAPVSTGSSLFQTFTASLSFAGVQGHNITKLLLAVLSFTGANLKTIQKTTASVLSFVGTRTSLLRTSFTAALSFVGNTARTIKTILTAPVLSFVGSLPVRSIGKRIAATLSFIGADSALVRKLMTASLSFVGNQTRLIGRVVTGVLSFVGSSNQRTNRLVNATLVFVGANTRQITKGLVAAVLSFTGATAKLTSKSLIAATISFVGQLVASRVTLKTLIASLAFVGSTSNRIGKSLTATLTSSGTIVNFIRKGMTASVAFVGSNATRTTKGLVATLSFTGSVTRLVIKAALTATLSFVGAMTAHNVLLKALTATLTFAGSATIQTRKSLTATLTTVGVLSRSIRSNLAATLSFTGSVTRLVIKAAFTATISFVGAVAAHNVFLKALTATLTFAGSVTIQTRKSLTATLTSAGVLSRSIKSNLSASLSFVGTVIRQTRKTLTAAVLSFNGAFVHTLVKLFSGVLSFTGSQSRQTGKAVTAILSFTGTQSRQISKLVSATLSFVGSRFAAVRKIISANLSFVGSVFRARFILLSGALSFTGAQLRTTGKRLTAVLNYVGTTRQGIRSLQTGALSFVGANRRSIRKGLTATVTFVGSFASALNAIRNPAFQFTAPARPLQSSAPTRGISMVASIRNLSVTAPNRKLTARAMTYVSTILGDNPVAYWRLGEAAGAASYADSSGHAYTMTWNGAGTAPTATSGTIAGDSDGAQVFTDQGGSLNTPYVIALHPTVFTYEMWLLIANGAIMRRVFDNGSGSDAYILGGGSTTTLTFQIGAVIQMQVTGLNDGNWHHLVWTNDGITTHLYKDGTDITPAYTQTTPTPSNTPTTLGNYSGGATCGMQLDEFAIYSYALTAAQTLAHYRAGVAAAYAQSSTLTAPSRPNIFTGVPE